MVRQEPDGPARQRPITVAALLRTWQALEARIEALAPDDSRLSIVCDHAREVRQVYRAVTSPGATADRFILARAVTTRADAMLRLFWGPMLPDLRGTDPGFDALGTVGTSVDASRTRG